MVWCAARVICSPLRQHCDPFSVLAHTLRTFRGAKSRRGRADQLAKRLLPPVRVDPCPPCLVLCVGGVGFRVLAHRAHLGRFGGSRWGWVLEIKFPCRRTGTGCSRGSVWKGGRGRGEVCHSFLAGTWVNDMGLRFLKQPTPADATRRARCGCTVVCACSWWGGIEVERKCCSRCGKTG